MTNNITVNIPYFEPFDSWLPKDSKKKFEIQLRKYFELKYTKYHYTEDDIDAMVEEVFGYISGLD